MRALKLLGPAADGAHLVCEDRDNGELFTIAAAELRAFVLPPVNRPAPAARPAAASSAEPTMRPREIQARIRSGATLQEVADEAGCDASRIERFAYPVLMERSVVADQAKQAHPVVDGLPSRTTVEKLVRETLTPRGQSSSVQWDAYRTEDGVWVLRLIWNAGHTENTARFTYHAGPHGGTVTALDEAAGAIIDPAPRPLRTVPEAVVIAPPAPPLNPLATQQTVEPTPEPTAEANSGPDGLFAETRVPERIARTGTEDSGRRQRAPMPSWEDVLLGTRSPNQ